MAEETCPACHGTGKILALPRDHTLPVWKDRNFITNLVTVILVAVGGWKLNDQASKIDTKADTAAVRAEDAAEVSRENHREIRQTRSEVDNVSKKLGAKKSP